MTYTILDIYKIEPLSKNLYNKIFEESKQIKGFIKYLT